jgi:hypothetical protein
MLVQLEAKSMSYRGPSTLIRANGVPLGHCLI